MERFGIASSSVIKMCALWPIAMRQAGLVMSKLWRAKTINVQMLCKCLSFEVQNSDLRITKSMDHLSFLNGMCFSEDSCKHHGDSFTNPPWNQAVADCTSRKHVVDLCILSTVKAVTTKSEISSHKIKKLNQLN